MTQAGSVEAHVAGEEGPGVLVLMDAPGLRRELFDLCDEIAGWGYRVLAPNTFHRSADVAAVREAYRAGGFPQVQPWMVAQTADDMVADGGDFLTWFGDEPVAVVGFCMGAKYAVRVAGAYPDRVSAAAGFHGAGLVTDEDDSPHLSLATVRARLLMAHAKDDVWNPAVAIETFGRAMVDAGVEGRNETYDAPHGFMFPDLPSHDAAARERGMAELRELFAG